MPLKAKKNRRERSDKEQAIKEVQKSETRRLNIEIPVEMHRKLKLYAMDCDKNMTEIVLGLIDRHLKRNFK